MSDKKRVAMGFEISPYNVEVTSSFIHMMFKNNNTMHSCAQEEEDRANFKEYDNINAFFTENKEKIVKELELLDLNELEVLNEDVALLYESYCDSTGICGDTPIAPDEYLKAYHEDEVCPECGELLTEVGFTAVLDVKIEYDKGYGKWRQEYVDDGAYKCNNCEEYIYLDTIEDLDFEMKIS